MPPHKPQSNGCMAGVWTLLIILGIGGYLVLSLRTGANARAQQVKADTAARTRFSQELLSQPATQTASAPAPIVCTLSNIIGSFDTNSVGANDWFTANRIEVTANLERVTDNRYGGGRCGVVFRSPVYGQSSRLIIFWFDPDERALIGSLTPGALVTVTGSLQRYDSFTHEIDFDGDSISKG